MNINAIYGVFGGTFDPPHTIHEMVVNAAINEMDFRKVFVVPTSHNPLKADAWVSHEHRCEMARIAFRGSDKVEVVPIDDSVYMLNTINHLMKEHDGEYWVIVGSDILNNIIYWKHIEELASKVRFLVCQRECTHDENSFVEALELLPDFIRTRMEILDAEVPSCSSTEFRKMFSEQGLNYTSMCLDGEVARYINENKLYQPV